MSAMHSLNSSCQRLQLSQHYRNHVTHCAVFKQPEKNKMTLIASEETHDITKLVQLIMWFFT